MLGYIPAQLDIQKPFDRHVCHYTYGREVNVFRGDEFFKPIRELLDLKVKLG